MAGLCDDVKSDIFGPHFPNRSHISQSFQQCGNIASWPFAHTYIRTPPSRPAGHPIQQEETVIVFIVWGKASKQVTKYDTSHPETLFCSYHQQLVASWCHNISDFVFGKRFLICMMSQNETETVQHALCQLTSQPLMIDCIYTSVGLRYMYYIPGCDMAKESPQDITSQLCRKFHVVTQTTNSLLPFPQLLLPRIRNKQCATIIVPHYLKLWKCATCILAFSLFSHHISRTHMIMKIFCPALLFQQAT